jgi:hypothetical protein
VGVNEAALPMVEESIAWVYRAHPS